MLCYFGKTFKKNLLQTNSYLFLESIGFLQFVSNFEIFTFTRSYNSSKLSRDMRKYWKKRASCDWSSILIIPQKSTIADHRNRPRSVCPKPLYYQIPINIIGRYVNSYKYITNYSPWELNKTSKKKCITKHDRTRLNLNKLCVL